MAVGIVIKYNQFEKQLAADANRQWDDATAGNIMFCLCDETYTPVSTHTTTTDLSGLITAGDGAPIAATSLAIDNTTTAGTTYLDSASASFGTTVTITAKYFIAVMPVTAGTFSATTSNLLFWLDLNTTNSSATVSSAAADFVVLPSANGWIKFT